MQVNRQMVTGTSVRSLVALGLLGFAALSPLERGALAGAPALDFNRDIRPILAENCFYCHGQDPNKRQAELRLDVRDVAIEAAIVPHDPPASELVSRINSNDPSEQMPPPKSNRHLSPEM